MTQRRQFDGEMNLYKRGFIASWLKDLSSMKNGVIGNSKHRTCTLWRSRHMASQGD